MGRFADQLPGRLRQKAGPNLPSKISALPEAHTPDHNLEMRRRTVLASDAYDSTNSKKRDAAQCAAVHNAIWFQLLSGVPARFLQPLMDLVIDLEDHDSGLTVARFAPREKQGDFDSSLKWTARAHLVGLVYARYRIDGRKSYPKACRAVISAVNDALPDGVNVGVVIGSRHVTDSEVEKRRRQKQDQMTRWINRLDDYRKKFEHGAAGYNGEDGWAHKAYEAILPMARSGDDDDSPEADAAVQQIYKYLLAATVTRITRAL